MSNHKRWKHIHPKGSEEYKLCFEKVRAAQTIERVTKTCICEKCGKEFEQTRSIHEWEKGNFKRFCSRACANSRVHTESTKKKIQSSLVKYYGKHDCVSAFPLFNRKRLALVKCPICGKLMKENHKACSRECSIKLRYGNVDRTALKYYRRQCAFKFALNQFPDEFDFSLIEKYGWYSAANSKHPNLNGVSRDHMVSVKYGWLHGISPDIISHPANCKLVLQNDNASKHDDCSISYEQLLERIENWNKKYGGAHIK